jgi:hypothetical protein
MPNIIQLLINLLGKINKKEEDLIPQGTNTPSVQIIVPAPITLPVLTASKKRALCFGINDYPGRQNDLRGCLNDVLDWSNLLKNVYKFDEVTNIVDSNCTKENITKAMAEIIEKSVAGDVVVISYSGHGTYLPDLNGDEEDGKDEAIYLYNGSLIDDNVMNILLKIKDNVHTTIIFDSCFSGTGTRAFSMDNDAIYKVPRFMPSKDEGKMMCLKVNSKIFRSIGQTEEEMKEILISGCSNTQTSCDAYIDGRYNGALSYYAIKVLQENPIITYNNFYKMLREKLPSSEYNQEPQLEGKKEFKNRLMFS